MQIVLFSAMVGTEDMENTDPILQEITDWYCREKKMEYCREKKM